MIATPNPDPTTTVQNPNYYNTICPHCGAQFHREFRDPECPNCGWAEEGS